MTNISLLQNLILYFDAKLKDISDRVTSNKSKHLLVETELKKLKTFDLSYFRGKNCFSDNNINYLVFEASLQYIDLNDDSPYDAISWGFIRLSKEVIKLPKSHKKILSPIAEGIFPKEKWKLSNSRPNHIYT